jgi:hypothetical protein
MTRRKKPPAVYGTSPVVRENFRREIEKLLADVPAEQWADDQIRGVLYEFVPWHRMSSVTIQTQGDDPRDIGAWKYYFSAESDGSLIREEHEAWHKEKSNKRLVYHRLLIEAAEALLSLDVGNYCNKFWATPIDDAGFCLNKTFLLQVYDVDESFRFNYCEYVLARRLEPA